jgi:predicted NBD/HSP70 family sugar kinase
LGYSQGVTAQPTTTQRTPGAPPPPGASASRQHTLRERNLRLVARAIYDAAATVQSEDSDTPPPSRADVAAATGLTRATVSTLVDRLVVARLVAELPPLAVQRAGRPAVPLVPAARTVVGLGLEVNVDYLGVRVLDLTGDAIDEVVERGAFHDSDPATVLGRLGALAADAVARAEADGMTVAAARLALPGLVDARTGELEVAPNLGWSSLDPVPLLGLGDLPVHVANEAKLAAVAELAGDVPDSFLYVSGDVGIGAAIVVDRALFLAERGWNGEVGHVVVDPAGPRCSCGARGCLEQYAGKEAVLRAAGLPADASLATLLALLDDGAPAVGRAAAVDALARAGRALGSALADFVNLTGVPTVVLGGIYTELLPWLGDEVEAVLAERVLAAPFAATDVRAAGAGRFAALSGGAREVLRDVVADPAAWI